jgi:nucleoside triphosphate pyrophosphatase
MIGPSRPLVLGSASPRRREILGSLGIPLLVLPADIVEDTEPEEVPEAYLERIARGKLEAVAARLEAHPARATAAALLVADTTVVLDGRILGKPSDIAEAAAMLHDLTGRTHRVLTRYAIAAPGVPARSLVARTIETQVTLRRASADEIERYAATGEGLDKAGAYAAQGIGTFLVERVDGSYSNVVGLPACEVVVDLRSCGLLGAFPSSPASG